MRNVAEEPTRGKQILTFLEKEKTTVGVSSSLSRNRTSDIQFCLDPCACQAICLPPPRLADDEEFCPLFVPFLVDSFG